MEILIIFLLVVHVLVCGLMSVVVLMQVPASQGLGAAFGGGMTENVFGAQTTHVLSKMTVWLGIGFFAVTLALAMAYAHSQPTGAKIEQEVLATPTQSEPAEAEATGTSAEGLVTDSVDASAESLQLEAPVSATTETGAVSAEEENFEPMVKDPAPSAEP